ncbi:U6 snRNA-associated Sm-like protein LSm1 [Golovinomyces cichoracearum]|uniref:U6 snRNA-associated Sm-like protein LSm1 n=1 Tax=Golovinomyces cichoracearum TaxID=62708 RepID=A0A420J1S8_9PEZI|nr:U6 snRNA-associated Sm-like protein LSm1 [Golovinomyces cichoracearum]
MENLRLEGLSPIASARSYGTQILGSLPQLTNTQLPPQMFTTAAQLLDMTDNCRPIYRYKKRQHMKLCPEQRIDSGSNIEKLMVALRDGRKLIGTLRSWDQYANLVLQSTVERVFVPPLMSSQSSSLSQQQGLYADIPRGVFLVRGENVLLLGEIDLDKDDDAPSGYEIADIEVVQKIAKERKITRAQKQHNRLVKSRKLGLEGDNGGETLY